MASCYREFNQKSKGNKVKKGTTTTTYSNNNQIAKYYFLNPFILAPYFSFPEFAIDIDTVSRYNIYAEDATTSHNFFVYEITRDKTLRFTFFVVIEVENGVT